MKPFICKLIMEVRMTNLLSPQSSAPKAVVTNLGAAAAVLVDGKETDAAAIGGGIACFSIVPWNEADAQKTVQAMLQAGQQALQNSPPTVSQSVTAITTLAPHLASPVLTQAAQAVDEYIQNNHAGENTLQNVMSTALHLANNAHFLDPNSNSGQLLNLASTIVPMFFGQSGQVQASVQF